MFVRIGLQQARSAEQAHTAVWHIVGWNLEGPKLSLGVMKCPKDVSLTLDFEAFHYAFKPRYS